MSIHKLETDYLVVGAGAMGMAFTDEIIHGSRDTRVVLVDRRAQPGGHWNDAYSFIRLHQPALYYGVNSEELGSGPGDLASKAQILDYFQHVIEKLVATGRVSFFPLCDYQGNQRFRSMVEPDLEYEVTVHKKTVDGTYMNVKVPGNTKPDYEVASGVSLVPINGLARLERPWARYVIIGAGKTGLDALLYLLDRGVDPDRITWIVSNDAWMFNRAALMPKLLAYDFPAALRCIVQAESPDDVFVRLEAEGRLMRLDTAIWPTKYRCATVSLEELERIRTIRHVVRKGRVVRIEPSSIILRDGVVPTDTNTLHVDCTANGLLRRPLRPIFDGDRITLQPVAFCQQVFSASVLATVELRYDDDAEKNARCQPVQHPNFPADYFMGMCRTIENVEGWLRSFLWWMCRSRLSVFHHFGFFHFVGHVVVANRWIVRAKEKMKRFDRMLTVAATSTTQAPESSDGESLR